MYHRTFFIYVSVHSLLFLCCRMCSLHGCVIPTYYPYSGFNYLYLCLVLIGFCATSCCKLIARTLPLRKLKYKQCELTIILGASDSHQFAHKSLHHYSIDVGITVNSALCPIATLAFGKMIASPAISVLISRPSSVAKTVPSGKSVKFSTSSEKFNEKLSP